MSKSTLAAIIALLIIFSITQQIHIVGYEALVDSLGFAVDELIRVCPGVTK